MPAGMADEAFVELARRCHLLDAAEALEMLQRLEKHRLIEVCSDAYCKW